MADQHRPTGTAGPTDQPATVDTLAVFTDQCPPGTPWLERVVPLRGATDLAELS